MAEPKESRTKRDKTAPETTEQTLSKSQPTKPKKSYIPGTGLEDYGRWKSMFQDRKRDPKDPPFRRGRIWC